VTAYFITTSQPHTHVHTTKHATRLFHTVTWACIWQQHVLHHSMTLWYMRESVLADVVVTNYI